MPMLTKNELMQVLCTIQEEEKENINKKDNSTFRQVSLNSDQDSSSPIEHNKSNNSCGKP
eukprot:UN05714